MCGLGINFLWDVTRFLIAKHHVRIIRRPRALGHEMTRRVYLHATRVEMHCLAHIPLDLDGVPGRRATGMLSLPMESSWVFGAAF